MIVTAVGSYPKIGPNTIAPNLRSARAQLDEGKLTAEEFARVERQNTMEALQEQALAGLDLVTDGQMRRDDGQTYFARGIKGFATGGLIRYFDTNTYYRQPAPEAKLEWQGPISVEDYKFAASYSTKPVKAIVTGPYTLAKLSKTGCYKDARSLALDLAAILNREALALQKAGAPFIQFDEPAIVRRHDEIGLLEETSAIVTQGLTATTAVYTWFGDVAPVAERFFGLPFDVFGLDFVMGKDSWRAIEGLRRGKGLAAGIVDARNTRLESLDELVEAIVHLRYYVPWDRLYLNPSAGLEYLPRPNARAKLTRLAEAARKAQEIMFHE